MTDQNVLFAFFLVGYIVIPFSLVAIWLVMAARHQNHRIEFDEEVVNPGESDSS